MTDAQAAEGVAVVGLAGRFPRAATVAEFWGHLLNGTDCSTEFTVDQLVAAGIPREVAERPDYVRRSPVIDDPAGFDARLFKYSPKEAELIDPQQRIMLECAWEALEDAGYDPRRFPGLIGIWAGSGVNNYYLKNILARPGYFEAVADFQAIISNDKDYLASRVAYKLDLRGPAVVVQTACSTSLVAVHLAAQALMTYQCDMALAGGVSLQAPRAPGYLYREGEIFSPDGLCRPFDKGANGTVLGEGCGLVVLRRLEDAVADRDTILAVIRGSAVNNDGAARAGYTAPSVAGQLELITMALAVADVRPDEIGYVEAHGTGTALGDPIEVAALTQAFRSSTTERGFCGLGSVKSNIGHLDVAAGITGLIKTICALRQRQLPPTLHFTEPNPELNLAESPFFVVDRVMDWQPRHGRRIAGVSSFGLGGTNAHVIVEEHIPRGVPEPSRRTWHLLPASAATAEALNRVSANLAAHFAGQRDAGPADAAWTLAAGRTPLRHRRCVVADSAAAAAARFSAPDTLYGVEGEASGEHRPVVFLYSGQGTQYAGMGKELYRAEPAFRDAMDRCARLLGPIGGCASLLDILYGGDDKVGEQVNQTAVSQPALFALEYSLTRLLESHGVTPAAVVGHSIGEYAAACEAGVFSLEDALVLVRERGRLMQSMDPGAMIAVPRPEADVLEMLPADLDLAVVNAPAITVVSGPLPAIERFTKTLEEEGIMFRRLQTSHGFHSRMMEPAARAFEDVVRQIPTAPPRLPLASNYTGGWMGAEIAADRSYWARHLRHTARFGDNLLAVSERFESPLLLEVGPGNTLAAIARQHEGKVASLPSVSTLRHPRQQVPDQPYFLRALGALWCHGAWIDLAALYGGEKRGRVPLPRYPFQRQRLWIEREGAKAEPKREESVGWRRRIGLSRPGPHVSAAKPAGPLQPDEDNLRQLWCKVLGTQTVGVDDNFFELGGHSLLAVNIMVELEKAFGVRLPLATLIEAPTIRQLLRLMGRGKSGGSWSSLVPLSSGGNRTPFFLMHSHGGNILEYHALANLLKTDRPIYALQCRGLDGSPVGEPSVEEMAAHYLDEIRAVQPKGPYVLGGFCFGGYLALEAAHRLRARGEDVALLVLINSGTHLFGTYPPGTPRVLQRWYELRYRAALEWDELAGQSWQRKYQRLAMRARRVADLARTKAETVADRLPPASGLSLRKHSLTYHLEQLAMANDRAWARYRPRPYDGKVLFLRARRQPVGMKPDPLLGWDGLLTGELTVREVPGFRQNMLDEPNVPEVAQVILEHLS
jgi:acyl transferase domain-containing protein/thioesterase domain-containing protein